MLPIKRILLATDFSDSAEERVAYAFELARQTGGELHVLYADVLHGEPYAAPDDRPETEEAALEQLEKLTSKAAGKYDGQVRVKTVVERNVTPAPAILDYANTHDVDLIVVGTHGRRGVRRLILGSVAEEVLRMSRCPVLALRPRTDESKQTLGDLQSILVPIDFSKHSANALTYAKDLAALVQARLDLLHVVEETLHPAFYGITVQSVYDVQPDIEEKSVEQMKEMFAEAEGPDVDVTYEARPGAAAVEIVGYAEEKGSGMIVMGTHGLTGLDHFLMGSTTERVVRRSPAPVFAVKSFGKSLISAEEPQAKETKIATA